MNEKCSMSFCAVSNHDEKVRAPVPFLPPR
jgi:hypothetical protein